MKTQQKCIKHIYVYYSQVNMAFDMNCYQNQKFSWK